MSDGITTATDFLTDAIKSYLQTNYANPPIKVGTEIDKNLRWVPTLNCAVNKHLMLIEVSEKVYPAIFRMRHADMAEVQKPIAVYCVCPEEAYLNDQKDANDLIRHGFGLFTVNAEGEVVKKSAAIPIVQHITDSDYNADVKGLTPKVRREVQSSFEVYKGDSPAGVASITELVEGMVMKAAKEAVRKGWMTKKDANSTLANVIIKMRSLAQFGKAEIKLSGAGAFVSRIRNAAHHYPKSQKQAHQKYRDCRHSFLDGIRVLKDLQEGFKAVGLTGSL
ncbi:hypothetical protein [Aurantiacibacter spongiae]|uniref:Uncharacterized protein n=1 Tax=Aurantiacibacter spongiae TaxID=2488860 RepID=A0A3N5CZJ8_9SPHN|nr:hypothetical protein [Aurantiacibacter spongiae]RPF72149.1 hypothetical protein EG799_11350 [Aurantiacibacter spongiae]